MENLHINHLGKLIVTAYSIADGGFSESDN